MSASKLWSMISGMEGASQGVTDEKFTHQYLGKTAKELDTHIGYTEHGGRGEAPKPEDGTEERLADYLRVGELRNHPVIKEPAGNIQLFITDKNSKPLIAEIKLFPMEEGTTPEEFDVSSLSANFYRRYSDAMGCYSMRLTAGNYLLVISKGSEYGIYKSVLTVCPNQTLTQEVTLQRFINLTEQGYYVGDLHHHSVFSSPLYPPQGTDYVYDTPEIVAASMQAMGLTFGALSDHHNVCNHRIWEKLKNDEFLPILSKEISTTNGHILALNTDPDVVYRIPSPSERTSEYLRQEFIRTTNEIKSLGGHPQVNHPRDMQSAISFPAEFTDMIEIFDTMEIWNGSHPMEKGTTNDQAMDLWLSLLEEGRFIAATTGSDTHEVSLEFWQDSLAYVFGLYKEVQKNYGSFHGLIKEKADYFLEMLSHQLPLVAEWSKKNLSSGCVRTYVHAPEERTPETILQHLKKGNSFVTNGPILLAQIDGKEMGEHAAYPATAAEITAKLNILSNRPLSKLYILQNGKRKKEISLPVTECANGYYDYSREVKFSAENAKWVVFQVKDNCTNQAITNPIFLEKK